MRPNGFSLVELLVVIALMALVAGVIVVSAGAPGSGARDSATRFATRLAAARDEAILSGQPVSAWVSASGYEFLRYRNGRWERMSAKPFDGADWDNGTRVIFEGDSARARVQFDTLGLPDEPLALRIDGDGSSAHVRLASTGDVRVD